MADLPRRGLVTDEAPVQQRRANDRVPHLPYSEEKHLSSMDERIDSGVGCSLESQEYSSHSFEEFRNFDRNEGCRTSPKQITPTSNFSRTSSDNCTSRLQLQIKNLSIRDSDQAKDSLKSNRCDSGICDSDVFSVEEPFIRAGFPECTDLSSNLPYESTFSTQELDELFSQDEDGDTHLHMSIIHMLPEVSLKIISLAWDLQCVNIANNLHQMPLHLAVATQQLLVARRLVVAGAAMDSPDHCGNTPLHIACREGLADMVQWLLTPVQHQETLANSFSTSLAKVPQDLSIRNYDGYTCTHLALQGGHLNILNMLLSNGANVNEPDGKSGRTLLHMAADLGCLQALELLLQQRNLNINARTYGGLTAISLAHGRHLNTIVELLYRVGADCSQLLEDSGESSDEEMSDCMYDDLCINGQPVQFS